MLTCPTSGSTSSASNCLQCEPIQLLTSFRFHPIDSNRNCRYFVNCTDPVDLLHFPLPVPVPVSPFLLPPPPSCIDQWGRFLRCKPISARNKLCCIYDFSHSLPVFLSDNISFLKQRQKIKERLTKLEKKKQQQKKRRHFLSVCLCVYIEFIIKVFMELLPLSKIVLLCFLSIVSRCIISCGI